MSYCLEGTREKSYWKGFIKVFCFEMFRFKVVDMKTVMEPLGNSEETLSIYVLKSMLKL